MKKTTVQAVPGRSVPLSATCIRPDNGPRIITADQGDVELELRDLVAVQYIRGRVKRGDLIEPRRPAPRVATAPATTGRKD
jgi:hypothetical protein